MLGQKNVKRSFLNYQYVADLQDSGSTQDMAYERVVTQSHEVNRLSLSESDNQPFLRGEPLHNSLRITQNSTSSRGPVTYKNFVGQRLRGTQRPVQHIPESSWQFTALWGVTLYGPLNRMLEEMFEESDMWLVEE